MLRTDGQIQRCQAEVEHSDTYRYSGRGSSGFEMSYDTEQCSFKAKVEQPYRHGGVVKLCSRHAKLNPGTCLIFKCNWDDPWKPRKPLTKNSKQVY